MSITDPSQLLRLLAALLFVLALMGGLALVLRKLGLTQTVSKSAGKRRLNLLESLPLDSRRRAVLLERDDIQHLLILGPNGETVIETGIKKAPNHEKPEQE